MIAVSLPTARCRRARCEVRLRAGGAEAQRPQLREADVRRHPDLLRAAATRTVPQGGELSERGELPRRPDASLEGAEGGEARDLLVDEAGAAVEPREGRERREIDAGDPGVVESKGKEV